MMLFAFLGGEFNSPGLKELPLSQVEPVLAQEPAPSYVVTLPLVARRFPLKNIFGVEMKRIHDGMGLEQIKESGASWIRRGSLLWSEVENIEGQYDWTSSKTTQLETDLQVANNNGRGIILVIFSTPSWAQKVPGYSCGPVHPDHIDSFANFIYQAVLRYSVPPYNVKYWQIWNEPEAAPYQVPPNIGYGCWGDPEDEYFGGGYYAEVLKEVYQKIKEADPEAQVVLGGLLLACNPELQEICPSPSLKFFEGILRRNGANDGGNYLDMIAFHGYDNYYGLTGSYGNTSWQSKSDTHGPVVSEKAKFIRSKLAEYNLDLPLMVTEAALLCGSSGQEPMCLTADFENTKAYYTAQLYGTSIAEGFDATIWYSVLGWRGSGLLDPELNPVPAYYAYTFARKKLENVTFDRHITEYPGIRGFVFNQGEGTIWLLWSTSGEKNILLPGTPLEILDSFGEIVPVTGPDLKVTENPLYIEWPIP
jgi:hypothetical protein